MADLNLEKKCFTLEERNKIANKFVELQECRSNWAVCQSAVEEIKTPEAEGVGPLVLGIVLGLIGGAFGANLMRR